MTENLIIFNARVVTPIGFSARCGREMEENTGAKTGAFQPVNIPVQMFCAVDRTGVITPLQFRFELSGHRVELIKIERTLSRDEKNYVESGKDSISARR